MIIKIDVELSYDEIQYLKRYDWENDNLEYKYDTFYQSLNEKGIINHIDYADIMFLTNIGKQVYKKLY